MPENSQNNFLGHI